MTFYIVRDKDGDLWLTNTKPLKNEDFETWSFDDLKYTIDIPNEWFPEVTWEDKEPAKFSVIKE